MIESIEKLRARIYDSTLSNQTREELDRIADEIEREIVERYMELPRLCDGIIKPGDAIESVYDGESFIRDVDALIWDGDRWDFDLSGEDGDTRDCASLNDFYECSHHVKPRTVEDVLESFIVDYDTWDEDCKVDRLGERRLLFAKYADEIRKVGGVNER